MAPRVGADQFRLENASLPVPILDHARVNVVIEASGVEPVGDGRHLIIAHDKAAPLHVLDLATGALVGEPITAPKFPATANGGPKWEGMARDSEGAFYVVGAHNGKTDEERAAKSHLMRFRLKDSAVPMIDQDSVSRFEIARSLVAALKAEGLDEAAVGKRKIEGLAIREKNGGREIVIGLREPGDKVRAFVADVSKKADGAALELKPLFAFEAEPREGVQSQLTSMEYVPPLGGFLVVTASEDADNAFHGNNLWFVADGETRHARKIATFEVAMKAEGLAVLGVETAGDEISVRLLVTYDNDPHATKIPSRFQTVTLVRASR
ncbi:MAG: hypothetical protein P4L84_26165 [Isosphaeraceae bacterium]|nr:hypothetical protein [Isosphaeraceae bacterium]